VDGNIYLIDMNWLGDYCNYIKGISSGVELSGVEWSTAEYSAMQCIRIPVQYHLLLL
jgi:hypothetical protein